MRVVVLWVVMSCSLVGIISVSEEYITSVFRVEDGKDLFLRDGNYFQTKRDHTLEDHNIREVFLYHCLQEEQKYLDLILRIKEISIQIRNHTNLSMLKPFK
jgi:hypothetical protein